VSSKWSDCDDCLRGLDEAVVHRTVTTWGIKNVHSGTVYVLWTPILQVAVRHARRTKVRSTCTEPRPLHFAVHLTVPSMANVVDGLPTLWHVQAYQDVGGLDLRGLGGACGSLLGCLGLVTSSLDGSALGFGLGALPVATRPRRWWEYRPGNDIRGLTDDGHMNRSAIV
jgi:hypothetical protein